MAVCYCSSVVDDGTVTIKPRLFVSHASGGDRAFLETCVAEFAAAGFEVLIDYDQIDAGGAWRNVIHEMLVACDAAVVLFGERALTSRWVLKEATILTWRHSLDRAFKVVPVLLPGVSPPDLVSETFSPLQLDNIQQVAANDAREIAAVVGKSLVGLVRSDSPFDRLAIGIADLLGRVGDGTLELACRRNFQVPYRVGPHGRRQFAELLADKILLNPANCVAQAIQILKELSPTLTADVAAQILSAVETLWVDPEAAGAIPPIVARVAGRHGIFIHGTYIAEFTAEMYVRRAFLLDDGNVNVVPIDAAPAGEWEVHVVEGVRSWWRENLAPRSATKNARRKDADVDAYINLSKSRWFILVPTFPSSALVSKLRVAYPKATYLYWCEEAPAQGDRLPDGVYSICPPLDPDVEAAAFVDWNDKGTFLNNLRNKQGASQGQ